jgi:hypothetical protein
MLKDLTGKELKVTPPSTEDIGLELQKRIENDGRLKEIENAGKWQKRFAAIGTGAASGAVSGAALGAFGANPLTVLLGSLAGGLVGGALGWWNQGSTEAELKRQRIKEIQDEVLGDNYMLDETGKVVLKGIFAAADEGLLGPEIRQQARDAGWRNGERIRKETEEAYANGFVGGASASKSVAGGYGPIPIQLTICHRWLCNRYIKCMLTPGEFVVRRNGVNGNIRTLLKMNRGQLRLDGFGNGGMITNNINLNSTGSGPLDARRMIAAINREQQHGTARVW